jgi:7-carboxy-7-deazaguanine synthase
MPGGRVFLSDTLQRANELKMPVGKPVDVEAALQLRELALGQKTRIRYWWFQPLSAQAKTTELAMRAAITHNFRLSLQTHRFVGIR